MLQWVKFVTKKEKLSFQKSNNIVYFVDTNYTPKMELTESGKVNWSALLENLASNNERNELIIDIIKYVCFLHNI